VSRTDLPFEFMLNALRLRDGFPVAWMTERTGLAPTVFEHGLKQAEQQGLVVRDWQTIRPTEKGFDFLSDLQTLFLP